MIATGKPTYAKGEPIDVTWNWAPGNRWDWIGVYPRHADVSSYLDYIYTGATVQGTGDGRRRGRRAVAAEAREDTACTCCGTTTT